MSRELTKMNQLLTPHLSQAIDASKEITFHMEKTAEGFNKLGSAAASIHKTYQSVADKFDFELLTQIESVYSELSKTFSSYSKVLFEEKENFSVNIENFFTFCTCEVEGLEEVSFGDQLLNLRNEFSIEYKEKRQLLDAKKEAMYPTMDLKKWEIDQDSLPIPKTQLIGDKATALKYMFPKVVADHQETQDVKNLRDFWAFCNSQISNELRDYGRMKLKRMNDQIGGFVEGFNKKINKTLSLFIDLQTKLITL